MTERLLEHEMMEKNQAGFELLYGTSSDQNLALTFRIGSKTFERKIKRVRKSGDDFADFWAQYIRSEPSLPIPLGVKQLVVADLFCATGGLSSGFKSAASLLGIPLDFNLAVDVDSRALELYKYHHKGVVAYSGSLEDLVDYQVRGMGSNAKFPYQPELTAKGLELVTKNIDVILAGPPCQGNSTMNVKTRYDDPRNKLYLAAVAFAISVQAKVVLIENVPGVLRDVNGVVSSAIILLKDSGYHITQAVLAADKLGWPQTRKRFFLIATREACEFELSDFASSLQRHRLPLKWAISDLTYLSGRDVLHSSPELSEENILRIKFLQSENLQDLPLHLRPKSHREGTTFTTVYGKLDWDKPSGTITTGFLSPGRGRYIHPDQPRALSPIEASRLQGFPDDYFKVDNIYPQIKRSELAKWIGDAVPSILGFYTGLTALSGLSNEFN